MFNVRMSEVIESASTHAHATALTDATLARGSARTASSATPSAPPSIALSPPPMRPSAQAIAQPLYDRHLSLSSRLSFVPAHFLALPDALKLPPAGQGDWCDPLGPQTARINATPLSLKPTDSQRAGHTRGSREGVTAWSQFMKQPVVLQMQSVADQHSRAAGGLATALLATGTTDLIVVDALVRDPEAQPATGSAAARARTPALTQKGTGFPAAFPRENPVTDIVTDRLHYTFPEGAPYRSVQTDTQAPTKPKAGMPHGALTISLKGADGSSTTHPVRTHTLNLNSPDWPHQLLFALNAGWQRQDAKPLQLALMCKDGATASGVVATALHGMECLEALNRGDIRMQDPADLAARLDDFILAGQSVRSPAFAQVGDQPVDTRTLAADIWKAWVSLHSKPDSTAVQTYRHHQMDDGVWLDADDTRSSLDAIDGPATAAQTDVSAGLRASAGTSRLLSSSSEDSGVLSDTTFSTSQFSTVARGERASALSPKREVPDGEGDPWAKFDAAVSSPVRSPAASLPRGLAAQVASLTGGSTANSTINSTATLSARRPPEPAIELPPTDGMPARRLHPASRASDAEVRTLLAELTAPAQRAVRSPSGDEAKPLTPLQTALTLTESRSAAQDGNERMQVPRHIRKDWMPGAPKFNAYYSRLDGLVKEMTARTGVVGYLRARLTDPITRTLEPHTHWARDLINEIHADMVRELQSRPGRSSDPVPHIDHAQVAAAAHEAVQRLVAQRFSDLTPREQSRWRARVDGGSPRFNLAFSSSLQRVHELPRRFLPNGTVADAPLTAEPPKTQAPPIFMSLHRGRGDAGRSGGAAPRPWGSDGMRSAEDIRKIVDREWSTHWVLSMTREVAEVGR